MTKRILIPVSVVLCLLIDGMCQSYAQDSLFVKLPRYEPADTAMTMVLDWSCDWAAEKDVVFIVSMISKHRTTQMHILVDKIAKSALDTLLISEHEQYGIVEHKNYLFFLEGMKDSDLFTECSDWVRIPVRTEICDDFFLMPEELELFVFDQLQMYRYSVRPVKGKYLETLLPIGTRMARNKSPYKVFDACGRLIFETAYYNDGDVVHPMCRYYDLEGNVINVEYASISFKKGKKILEMYNSEYNWYVGAYVYYDMDMNKYEIRDLDLSERGKTYRNLLDKHIRQLLKKEKVRGNGLLFIYYQSGGGMHITLP